MTTYACIAPSQPSIPIRISGTNISIKLGWSAPSDDGGCPLSSYRILRDAGDNGAITTEVDATDVNDKSYLNSYDVVLDSNETSKVFRF